MCINKFTAIAIPKVYTISGGSKGVAFLQCLENLPSFTDAPTGFMAAAADGQLVQDEPLLDQLMSALLNASSTYVLRCHLH